MKITRTYKKESTSHKVGELNISPTSLIKLCGTPNMPLITGFKRFDSKVSGEYFFEVEKDGVTYNFTIYDWKATSLYDERNPSVDEFWTSDDIHDFSIGGNTKEESIWEEFRDELLILSKGDGKNEF